MEEKTTEEDKLNWYDEFRNIKQHLLTKTKFNTAVIEHIKLVIE